MPEPSAAQTAKCMLQTAALHLGTASPARVQEISRVLDDSLPYPVVNTTRSGQKRTAMRFRRLSRRYIANVSCQSNVSC